MIGIIGALDVEVEGIKDIMSATEEKIFSSVTYTSGKIQDQECVLAMCGMGKVNAAICAQTMILKYHPDEIICLGIAGSLSDDVKCMDVVIAKDTVQYDMDVTTFGDERGFVQGPDRVRFQSDERLIDKLVDIVKQEQLTYHVGTMATGDTFIADAGMSNEIANIFSAVACDMECGSIGHVCCLNDVPYAAVKTISDDASVDGCVDYWSLKKIAANRSIHIVKSLCGAK